MTRQELVGRGSAGGAQNPCTQFSSSIPLFCGSCNTSGKLLDGHLPGSDGVWEGGSVLFITQEMLWLLSLPTHQNHPEGSSKHRPLSPSAPRPQPHTPGHTRSGAGSPTIAFAVSSLVRSAFENHRPRTSLEGKRYV